MWTHLWGQASFTYRFLECFLPILNQLFTPRRIMKLTWTQSNCLIQDKNGLWIQPYILPLSLLKVGNLPGASLSLCHVGKGEYSVSFAQILGEVGAVRIRHSSLRMFSVSGSSCCCCYYYYFSCTCSVSCLKGAHSSFNVGKPCRWIICFRFRLQMTLWGPSVEG